MSRVEKPHVLLADDNEATCTLMTALLQREFAVESVHDGRQAVEKLTTRRYAALLLDLRMPQTDGFAVLEHLQESSPEMLSRTLIVTAALTQSDLMRARKFPVCGIISKPFEIEHLLTAVRQCAGIEGPGDGTPFGSVLVSSGSVILLIADLVRQRLL